MFEHTRKTPATVNMNYQGDEQYFSQSDRQSVSWLFKHIQSIDFKKRSFIRMFYSNVRK